MKLALNSISAQIIDAAYHIHYALGPGLLESVYGTILAGELEKGGLQVARQVAIPITYAGYHFEAGFRADLVVEDAVIIEVKSVEAIHPVHQAQLLTYLRLADKRLGLLINFNVLRIKDGITRVANRLAEGSLVHAENAEKQRTQRNP